MTIKVAKATSVALQNINMYVKRYKHAFILMISQKIYAAFEWDIKYTVSRQPIGRTR